MERLMLKPREAAELIGVGRTVMYRLIRARIIPSCRVGNSIRVPVAGLRAWAEAQSQIGESASALPTAKSRF
jgi:excisionase family DNA binding protein